MFSDFVRRALYSAFIYARCLAAPAVIGVSAMILDELGRVLLVRHGYRAGWHMPGGGVVAGEGTEAAVRREMAEEVGLAGGRAMLVGLFVERVLWVGHVVALYRFDGASVDFRASWEIREMMWADPKSPPPGTGQSTRRRLAELDGATRSPIW